MSTPRTGAATACGAGAAAGSCPQAAGTPVGAGAAGGYQAGSAPSVTAGSVAVGAAGRGSLTAGTGTTGQPSAATAGTRATAGGSAATAGRGAAGSSNTGGPGRSGTGGPASSSGGTGGASTGSPGENVTGVSQAELDMLRQTCVDEINMYRASLSSVMLKPLKRATAAQEECSDRGAKADGDSMQAHGSARAGLCRSVGLGAENTCPGWPIGGFSGNATIADALKKCLMQMWAEAEPPEGRAACIQDTAGCFQKHGHYLNMSDPSLVAASCAFYKMSNGAYWMNQDFSYK